MKNCRKAKETNREQFGWLYKVLCQERQVKPLPAVQAYLKKNCLRFCVDRVALKDWSPILNSIAENRTLTEIYVYSRCRCKKIQEKVKTEQKLEKLWRCGGNDRTRPILYTNFLLRCLVDSVAVFARDALSITSITFDGIPLAPRYLNILCSGLKTNRKLTNLSLTKCYIGDIGCDLLLGCLRNNPNLCVLNLSSCCLTNRSAMSLSLFLRRRKADLLQNVWEECSLQSREKHSSKNSQGLHTLILSQNKKFGDNGVRHLMQALKSDIWLKTLDLKHCGITKHGAEAIIEVLRLNSTITKMDLTKNHIPINTLQEVLRILKRRREIGENVSMKERLLLNWKNASLREFKNNGMQKSLSKNAKRLSRLRRLSRSSLQTLRLRRLQRLKGMSLKRTKEPQTVKKDITPKKRSLHELKSQLLKVISSNSKLKVELASNKVLLDTEVQERSRTEDELQKISLQLNNLRSKVIMVNCLHSKVRGESQLLKSLRNVFDKFGVLSTGKSLGNSEAEGIVGDTESRSSPLMEQKIDTLEALIA